MGCTSAKLVKLPLKVRGVDTEAHWSGFQKLVCKLPHFLGISETLFNWASVCWAKWVVLRDLPMCAEASRESENWLHLVPLHIFSKSSPKLQDSGAVLRLRGG